MIAALIVGPLSDRLVGVLTAVEVLLSADYCSFAGWEVIYCGWSSNVWHWLHLYWPSRLYRTTVSLVFIMQPVVIATFNFILRRLWLTCVVFGVVGVASALGMIPIFADMLVIAK